MPEPEQTDPVPTDPLREAIAIMARLRGPGGCPWDREQTFESIKRHTLEETYEVFDAIDRQDWPHLKDELGDLLLQVLFYAQMAREAGYFSMDDVAANLNAKLIRRHPHIFADATAATSADVKRTWESVKQQERAAKAGTDPVLLLDEVPAYLPAMLEASKLGVKAATVGFDWPDANGLFTKMNEELAELRAEVDAGDSQAACGELGDVLFTAVNLARHLGIEPEFALRAANARFRARFNAMEHAVGSLQALNDAGPDQLEILWQQAKSSLKET